jgi:osmotically-inducible protein OsmY
LESPQAVAGLGAVQDVETAIVMQLAASLVWELPQKVAFIDVSCQAETITLSGQVESQATWDLAEKVARQYPGELTIVNNLQILSPGSPDSPARP